MFLLFTLLLTCIANLWLGWNLGYPVNIGGYFSLPLGFLVFLGSIPVVALFSGAGWVALGLVGMVFGKHDDRKKWQRFFWSFLRGWWWLAIIIWLSPWIGFGILKTTNEYAPATLPRITISNGEKTVVFQSMMHVASPEFYDDVRKDMEHLRDQDYIFFYEWVKKWSDESLERLNTLLGTELSPQMYDIFGSVAGLVFQWDEKYADILPSRNVDLSTDDIVSLADKNAINVPTQRQFDILKKLREAYPHFTPLQRYISRITARGILNLLLRKYNDPHITTELKKAIPVFDIILDKRNAVIVNAILTSPNQHIYVHYGAMHFEGILKWLQEKDNRWREINRFWYTVVR